MNVAFPLLFVKENIFKTPIHAYYNIDASKENATLTSTLPPPTQATHGNLIFLTKTVLKLHVVNLMQYSYIFFLKKKKGLDGDTKSITARKSSSLCAPCCRKLLK